jgi:UDPglucose 6-dehydrogenase
MNIAVVGMGHVGLVTAVALSAIGHEVIGIDTDEQRIAALQYSEPPYFEPGLQEELALQVRLGRLRFTTDPETAYVGADVVFICVGTPPQANGEANLIAVEGAAHDIGFWAPDGCVVVEKSTVPCGTHKRLIIALGGNGRLDVAANPEFLREGTALKDTLEPSRIVVGAATEAVHRVLRDVYEVLTDSGTPYIATDIATAELAKHASNSMLATKISFMNAIARICDMTGADVTKIAEIMGADPRIGPAFLHAGLGFGGFCFPKDVAALSHTAKTLGTHSRLFDEVLLINQRALESVYAKIEDALWNVAGKHIAVLGLAFKPDTDDIRYSPAVALCSLLLSGRAEVVAWDPQAAAAARAELPALITADSPYTAAQGADLLVIATEWQETYTIDFERLADVMIGRFVMDARNVLDDWQRSLAAKLGFTVIGVGR